MGFFSSLPLQTFLCAVIKRHVHSLRWLTLIQDVNFICYFAEKDGEVKYRYLFLKLEVVPRQIWGTWYSSTWLCFHIRTALLRWWASQYFYLILQIKFIVDGQWKVDPLRPIVKNNGYENNLLIITWRHKRGMQSSL